MHSFLSLFESLNLTLLAITPPIFIFSVTLLGYAISKAEQEEKAARENDKENIKNEIAEIEKTLKQVKNGGDTSSLELKVSDLRKKQIVLERKISGIKDKYSAINLVNTVVKPSLAFIANILLCYAIRDWVPDEWLNTRINFTVLVFQVLLLSYGVYKLYSSLKLVQEISVTKDESNVYDKMKNAYKQAMEEYNDGRKEDVKLKFVDKKFPLTVNMGTELEFLFRVTLTQGSILRNAYVWFFVDDGLELISPPEESSWRQSKNYSPASIRTVKILLGDLSIGPAIERSIKLKAPAFSGKFLLRYSVKADGFDSGAEDLFIEVC